MWLCVVPQGATGVLGSTRVHSWAWLRAVPQVATGLGSTRVRVRVVPRVWRVVLHARRRCGWPNRWVSEPPKVRLVFKSAPPFIGCSIIFSNVSFLPHSQMFTKSCAGEHTRREQSPSITKLWQLLFQYSVSKGRAVRHADGRALAG